MPGATLSASKPVFEEVLFQVLFQASMQADMTLLSPEAPGEAAALAAAELTKVATERASKFAEIASKGIAEAVYAFVSEIGININTPMIQSAPTGGPCTGLVSTMTGGVVVT